MEKNAIGGCEPACDDQERRSRTRDQRNAAALERASSAHMVDVNP
jgi:hypothetical protein